VESVQIIQIALIVFIGVVITQFIEWKRTQRRKRQFMETMELIRQRETGDETKRDNSKLF